MFCLNRAEGNNQNQCNRDMEETASEISLAFVNLGTLVQASHIAGTSTFSFPSASQSISTARDTSANAPQSTSDMELKTQIHLYQRSISNCISYYTGDKRALLERFMSKNADETEEHLKATVISNDHTITTPTTIKSNGLIKPEKK